MTDSPRLSLPIDPEERPIEGALLRIRNSLQLLKADKSNYVKSEDVMKMYEEVIVQVNALNKLRENKRDEQNRGAYLSLGQFLPLPDFLTLLRLILRCLMAKPHFACRIYSSIWPFKRCQKLTHRNGHATSKVALLTRNRKQWTQFSTSAFSSYLWVS
jgi:hypothetical protein